MCPHSWVCGDLLRQTHTKLLSWTIEALWMITNLLRFICVKNRRFENSPEVQMTWKSSSRCLWLPLLSNHSLYERLLWGGKNHQSVSSHKNCLINQKSCVKFELCLPNCFWTASEKNSLLCCLRPVMDCELKCLRLQEGSFIKQIRRQHVSSSRACNFMQIQSNLLLLILMVQQLPANVQSLLRVFNVICLHIRPLAINLLMQQVL